MMPSNIVPGTPFEAMARLAVSLHNAIGGLPIAMKMKGRAGVLVEDGAAREAVHEDEALDSVFSGDSVKHVRVGGGRHAGTVMFASAVVDGRGRRVAAVGIIDTLGLLSLEEFVVRNDRIDRQVCSQGRHE